MKLQAKIAFNWAHKGVEVESFVEGQQIDTDDQDLIDVSLAEGWAVVGENQTKAIANSPENKAHKTSLKDKVKKIFNL